MKFKKLSFVLLAVALSACANREGDEALSAEWQNVVDTAESGINVIDALADDQADETTVTGYFSRGLTLAPCTGRAIGETCVDGTKMATYPSCRLWSGGLKLQGWVKLEFSETDCSLDAVDDSVLRTHDYTFEGIRGGKLRRFSAEDTDYRGNLIGGGSTLIKTDLGAALSIRGIHEEITRPSDRKVLDVSVRTLESLNFQGGFLRRNRRLIDGSLEVAHNLAKFTATYSAEDLAWDPSCCYPVSGKLNASFVGSIQGEASLEFQSCGNVKITRNRTSKVVTLRQCE